MICTTDPQFLSNLAKEIIDAKSSTFLMMSLQSGKNAFFKALQKEIQRQLQLKYDIHESSVDDKLEAIVKQFIHQHKISCPEVIGQKDEVIQHAYELIEHLCDVVGYYEGQ